MPKKNLEPIFFSALGKMIAFQPEPIDKHDVVFTDNDANKYLVNSTILQNKSPVFRNIIFNIKEELKLCFSPNVVLSFFQTVYSFSSYDIQNENMCLLWKLLVEYDVECGGICADIRMRLQRSIMIDEDFLADVSNLAIMFENTVILNLAVTEIAKNHIKHSLLLRLKTEFLVLIISKYNQNQQIQPKPKKSRKTSLGVRKQHQVRF